MKDVRLLTLYKQHYLDDYDVSLESQITCLGYYDGLDIKKVENGIFGKEKNKKQLAAITEIWYSTGKSVEQLSGGHSNQNIGLFRYGKSKKQQEYTHKYWDIEKKLPYFSVAFLKIKESLDYGEEGQAIEQYFWKRYGSLEEQRVCIALTYNTIDNADLVVLIKSNSMIEIGHALDRIESDHCKVIYMHSILGIEEAYLQECKRKNNILNKWRGACCFIHDQIARIELHLAVRGGSGILKELKVILDKWNNMWGIQGYENTSYSYIDGRGNININFPQTNIRSLLVFLLPGGFSTHQNPYYKNWVYNIETDIFMEETPWKDIQGKQIVQLKDDGSIRSSWCRKLIQKYRQFCSQALEMEDDSLYACYQALIQTLNALDQYERFAMSRDIFDTIYPSFAIFDRKIDAARKEIDNDKMVYTSELLKEMMREYLECVNSVVYHTIHTEQVFLMIPGYSGTSFAIPIKLHLFYLWYVNWVIKLLNDCGKLHSCIIVPMIESRPDTRFIGMTFNNEEKLIHIRLSQRSLFRPEALMIILAHEMAHYIGRDIRVRDKRISCLLKTMAYYIAEVICPQEDIGASFDIVNTNSFLMMKQSLKENLQLKLAELFKKKKEELDKKYYGDDIFKPLMRWAIDVFKEETEDAVVYQCIHTITNDIHIKIKKDGTSYVQEMKQLYRIQQYFDRNRKMWLHSGAMQQIVKELLELYKEIFADMSAIAILSCEKSEFQNAFLISDGSTGGRKEKQRQIRVRIANLVVFQTENEGTQSDIEEKSRGTSSDHKLSQEELLKNNLTRYLWVNEHLKIYAEECYKSVKKRIDTEPEILKEVKDVYGILKNPDSDYDHIFTCINTCICKYKDLVKNLGGF